MRQWLYRIAGFGPCEFPRFTADCDVFTRYYRPEYFARLDWRARLRILWSGHVHVRATIQFTEDGQRVAASMSMGVMPPDFKLPTPQVEQPKA